MLEQLHKVECCQGGHSKRMGQKQKKRVQWVQCVFFGRRVLARRSTVENVCGRVDGDSQADLHCP